MAELTSEHAIPRPRLSRRTRMGLQELLGHVLLIGVGMFFLIPFLWMVSTALKSDQDVFRNPPTWLPHDSLTVEVGESRLPVYEVAPPDEPARRLALVSMADGRGTFVDPEAPATTFEVRMRYAEPVQVVGFRWRNFADAMKRATRPGLNVNFGTYVKNSLIISFFCIIGTLVSCAPAAYGFARIHWPGRDLLFMLVLSTMMLPFQVTMIPLYVFFTTRLRWADTFLPLIVPTFFGNGFDIFLLRQFFRTIPEELCDAARVDGASELRIFLSVVLPLSVPVLTTISVLTFLWAWNDFQGPLLYLTDPRNFTMALGLQDFQGRHEVAWNLLMAAAVVFTLPIVIAFFFAQRTFIQGVKMTGLKE